MSNLVSHFNLKPDNYIYEQDYEIFKDKEKLEKLKDELLEMVIDGSNGQVNNNIIIEKLDIVTKDMNLTTLERNYLYNLIDNEINGNGPITAALKDVAVNKIMVNSCKDIYIETSDGLIKDTSISFINNDHIIKTVEKLLEKNNCYYDKNNPIINTKLSDGSNLFAIFPPKINNPIFTIKKYNPLVTSLNEQVRLGTLTPYMARFLEAAIVANLNILVCGSALSGKSTFLSAFINLIPDKNRIIVNDTDSSINIKRDNIINVNNINLDYLNNLYPDNIIISSIDNNVLNNIIYMNKHKGIISAYTTNKEDYFDDITNEILVTNPLLNKELITYYLLNSVDLIVYLEKMPDNKIKMRSIREIDNNKLRMIFSYQDDEFKLYNFIPNTYKIIKDKGINMIDDIFKGDNK